MENSSKEQANRGFKLARRRKLKGDFLPSAYVRRQENGCAEYVANSLEIYQTGGTYEITYS